VLINQKLSRTVWQPFYTILDRLKKYQIDKDKSIDLPPSSTAEFRDMSLAISQLVNRNSEVYQSQKEFNENAAHELQTPLAICRRNLNYSRRLDTKTGGSVDLDTTDRITGNKDLLLYQRSKTVSFFKRKTLN
jgi:signal transduction histidine kinase